MMGGRFFIHRGMTAASLRSKSYDGETGTAESILEHSHHASAHGTTFAYSVA